MDATIFSSTSNKKSTTNRDFFDGRRNCSVSNGRNERHYEVNTVHGAFATVCG